jgi:hypothetical protein
MQYRFGLPERRTVIRGTSQTEPSRAELVAMILGMYREMPGLSLYLRQAARLFGVPAATCQLVLDHLVARNELQKTDDGQYTAA